MSSIASFNVLAREPQLEGVAPIASAAAVPTAAVLVAHCDPVVSAGLAAILTRALEFRVAVREPEASPTSGGDSVDADVIVADYNSSLCLIEANPGIARRILILTNSDSEAKIRNALQRGVRGYLLSGCSLAELVQGVRVVYNGGVALHPLAASRVAETMSQPELTPMERAILSHMMLGMTNKRIALHQGVAEGTVKTHVKSILAKLKVSSRTEAVVVAQRRGLTEAAGPVGMPRSRVAGQGRRELRGSPVDRGVER